MKKFRFYIYIFLIFLFSSPFWGVQIFGRGEANPSIPQDLPTRVRRNVPRDTNAVTPDTVLIDNTVLIDSIQIDSIPPDSVPRKKNALDAPVIYEAKDSIVFTSNNWGYLYGDSKVDYQTMSITAEKISMSMDSSTVHAVYGVDSIGEKFGYPVFKDNDTEYEMEKVSYNFKTKKAFIRNVITQQGEGYIVADRAKKNEDESFFMCDGRYTTCDNHEHPHFYLNMTKARVQPGKNVVTGPAYLVIEDLPLPIGVPFGFFPFSKKYSSGILMPSYGDELDRGFSLRGGGYYFALSDYMDLSLTGEIYTKGTWGLNARSTFRKRYKYNGSFDIKYLSTKTESPTNPNITNRQNDFSINVNYAQDPKASMFRTFTVNVNYRTTSFSRNNLDEWSSHGSQLGNRGSSITWNQRFPDSPFSLIINGSLNQNMSTSTSDITLPNLSVTMSRINPFKKKEVIGDEKWYEKIYMTYAASLENRISTKDSLIFKSNLMKDWRNGIKQGITLGTTISAGNINITPNLTYNERWYSRKITQKWDGRQNAPADTTYGFNRVYDFNFGVSLDTKLYGSYIPLMNVKLPVLGKLKEVRHVFTPSISFGAVPDFSAPGFGMYQRYKYYDAQGNLYEHVYSPFDKEIYGSAPRGKSGSIGLAFDNNIEAKFTKDSVDVVKSIIDNFSVSTNYNIMADSLRWSDISTSLRLKPTKTLTINVNARFDPYMYRYDPETKRLNKIDQLRLTKKGHIGRLMHTSYSISKEFNQDTFKSLFGKKKKSSKDNKDNDAETDDDESLSEGENSKASAFAKNDEEQGQYDEDGYLKNEIKWNIRFDYGMTYAYDMSRIDIEKHEYKRVLTHTLGFGGSIQPTKNWSFTFQSGWDFQAKTFAHMSCSLNRNLHCWGISATVIPFGYNTSYFVTLRVNSSMLQDLKYEQQSRRSSWDPNWH